MSCSSPQVRTGFPSRSQHMMILSVLTGLTLVPLFRQLSAFPLWASEIAPEIHGENISGQLKKKNKKNQKVPLIGLRTDFQWVGDGALRVIGSRASGLLSPALICQVAQPITLASAGSSQISVNCHTLI